MVAFRASMLVWNAISPMIAILAAISFIASTVR
jgi:hypothetical protein